MRKKKIIAVATVLCVLSLLLTLAGCGGESSQKEEGPATYVDDLGREVFITEIPQRIVSISPACTEILYALGLGDKVVGVTEFCDYPEEAKQKPKIGTFSTPNIESIVAVEPDLVLATGGIQGEIIDRMEELGLTVFAVNPKTFQETVEDIRKIGEITARGEEAAEIAGDMERRAAEVESLVEQRESSGLDRPKVFYEIYFENNAWTAGSDSIISDLISLAGGDNIGDAESSDYYEFSTERLISENPDVYILSSGSMFEPGDITDRPGWEGMKALQENRIYIIEDDLVFRTGPRLIEGLERIHEVLSQ